VTYTKPLPIITATNRPYWEAAARHELRLQRCSACASWIYPISVACQSCGEQDAAVWTEVSGHGRLSSWVVYHRAFAPFEASDVPYAVAEVELDEGPRLISHVVGAGFDELRLGMPLRVAFRAVTPEVTLVVFEPGEPA
jgi:uncharacterized protein